VCSICYTIIATIEYVNPEEFRTASKRISDPQLKKLLNTK